MLEVNKGVVRPQLVPQLLASHELARPVEKQLKNSKGLPLKIRSRAGFSQLAGAGIQLEHAESDDLA
jgi:hypothetical protein